MNRFGGRAAEGEFEAVVVTARCLSTPTLFGMRMQTDANSVWSATWAFAIKPEQAEREGYTSAVVRGAFRIGTGFPGCPGCGKPSYVQCSACGALGCWSGVREYWKCPACGHGGVVGGTISQMRAGSD